MEAVRHRRYTAEDAAFLWIASNVPMNALIVNDPPARASLWVPSITGRETTYMPNPISEDQNDPSVRQKHYIGDIVLNYPHSLSKIKQLVGERPIYVYTTWTFAPSNFVERYRNAEIIAYEVIF